MGAVTEVLGRARQGDQEALSTLYRHYLGSIFGYIATRVPDRTTAEDLTSEVFLQMVEGIHRLRTNDDIGFTSWLFRIAQVVIAGYYRKHKKYPVQIPLPDESEKDPKHLLISNDPESDPSHWSETREEWQAVVQTMNDLTEDQRQVLIGRLILGYDISSVARMIGKNVNAVKALQFRALQSLQRLLGKRKEVAW